MSAAAELTVKDVTDDADLEREFTDITIRSTSSSEGAVGDENALLVGGGGDAHDLWQQQQSKTSKTNGKFLIAHKHKTPLLCSNKVRDHPQSTVRPFVDKPELNKKGHQSNYTTCAFAFSTLVGDSGECNNTAAENNNNGNEDPPESDVGSRQDKKDNTSITLSEEGGGGNQDKLKKAWQTPETSSIVMTAVKYGVCLLAGFVFGMAIQKGAGECKDGSVITCVGVVDRETHKWTVHFSMILEFFSVARWYNNVARTKSKSEKKFASRASNKY